MKLNVALLQMASAGTDQEANQAKADEYCRRAASMGADIVLFPEMWNIGYTFPDPKQPDWRRTFGKQAVGADDDYVLHFRRLAAELRMAIAVTYLEKWPGAPRNTVSLIDRQGRIVLTYAKVHTCDFDQEAALTPGDDFPVCTLEMAQGELRVGCMICYDREHPEAARILMLKGAEIILTPNACTLEANRLGQFRVRAMENMLGVAMTNYAAPQENGHSVAYDGVAFGSHEESLDMLLVEAGVEEGVYLAIFDMDRLRAYRQKEAWGNAYRRPHRYGLLTSMAVEEPFIRKDESGATYDRGKR
jgi:N-carbamoylputrescine amidase